MVHYNELNVIEQAILNWRNDNPVLTFIVLFACVIIAIAAFVLEHRHNIKRQQQEISSQRAQRRAWIKQNGGL